MWIQVRTTFLDGRDRFVAGEVRCVDDEAAQRFIGNRWAAEVSAPPTPDAPAASGETVTLDIHSGGHDQVAETVSGG